MIRLTATNQSLELVTSSAAPVDVVVAFADVTADDATGGAADFGIAAAATTVIVPAPAASTQRQIQTITIRNKSNSLANTVTVIKDVGGTEREIIKVTLRVGDLLEYSEDGGWCVIDASGTVRASPVDQAGVSSTPIPILKVGTAAEAAGVWYCFAKDSGSPGAWSPGAPGLAGRATDGTQAADAGCIPVRNAATGANYLTDWRVDGAGTASAHALFDLLWVNSGIVVTTITAQAINSVAWPARDSTGAADGEGLMVGLLVTTVTTNAAAFANCTLSYTNEDGTAGRTATMASFPATAVVGSVVFFQLQAGDSGIRSIQSVTLGTSLVTGAVSLFVARKLPTCPVIVAGNPGVPWTDTRPGVRLYSGACLLPFMMPTSTNAVTVFASVTVTEK